VLANPPLFPYTTLFRSAIRMRGGLDAQGNLVALEYEARAADFNHVGYNEPETVLIAQLTGVRKPQPAAGSAALMTDMYAIPNRRSEEHTSELQSPCNLV